MRVWFNKTFSNVHGVLEAIRRGDRAEEFALVVSHDHPRFPGFLAAHESALEPADLRGDAYVDFCLDFCARAKIQIFVPGREAVALAENAARFAAQGVRLLSAASPENLRALHDKAGFYAQTADYSVPPPEFVAFDSSAAFDAAYASLRARHPILCVKPAQGVYGLGFRVIDETRRGFDLMLKGEMHHIPLADLRRSLAEAEPLPALLLMEYLDGLEYSADCLGDGTRLIACVQRRKPADGRYGQDIVEMPEIRRSCAELTERYGLSGLFNVQFREGRGGLRILEINPRFSGGVAMSGATGVNLPYLAMQGAAHGFDRLTPIPAAAVGARVLELPQALCLAGIPA